MNYQSILSSVSDMVRQAGAAILEVYNAAEGIAVETKSDNSPLTEADRRSNAILCAGLAQITPDVPIISEENKEIEYENRKNYDHYWLLDPLDGTKDFIKRNNEFTINVALMRGESPVATWLYVPCYADLYWAIRGQGAFWDKKNGECQQLRVASFTMQDSGLKIVCSRSNLNPETLAFIEQLDNPDYVSVGSALKFMLVARGDAHLYPRVAPTMEWDTAAAQLILEEAGGKLLIFNTDKPLVYNKANLLNPYFIAYGNVLQNT